MDPASVPASHSTGQKRQGQSFETAADAEQEADAAMSEAASGARATVKRPGQGSARQPEAPAAAAMESSGAVAPHGSRGMAQALRVLGLMVKGVSVVGEAPCPMPQMHLMRMSMSCLHICHMCGVPVLRTRVRVPESCSGVT